MALCSFTTIVGYASLLLSDNQGIRSFGLSALVGELTCVFAALVLAPALLDLRRARRRRAPRWPVDDRARAARRGDHAFVTTCRARRTTRSKTSVCAPRGVSPSGGVRRR